MITLRRTSLAGLNEMPSKNALMMTRIIWFALLMGPGIFLAIVALQVLPSQKRPITPQPLFVWIHLIMFAVVTPATFFIRTMIFNRARLHDGIRPSAYYVGNIVFWAGCEAVAFFGMVVAVLNGSLSPTIYVVVIALAFQVLTFPTAGKLGSPVNPSVP